MVDRYRRTVSFPHPNLDRPSKPSAAKSLHVRSCSLPCVRSHPLIPQLRDEINELRSWENSRPDLITSAAAYSSWLVNGLTRLKSVLDSLDDVLQMPQTHDALSQRSDLVEKLLENFLQFVDVFGIFQTFVLALKQELSGAHVAVRRKDDSKLAVHVKSQKKIAKEMAKLISAVRSIECPTITINGHDEADEIPCVIRDVHELTGVVSAAVFDGVMRSLGSARRRSTSWGGFGFSRKGKGDVEEGTGDVESMWGLMRKSAVEEKKQAALLMKKMKELDECVSGMEDGSERVFRSLICTRVSLLNILTHI